MQGRAKGEGLHVDTGKLWEAVRSYIVPSPHLIEKVCCGPKPLDLRI